MRVFKKSLKFFAAVLVSASAFLLFSNGTLANNISWFLSPSDPFNQNWSITSSITTDDNWDNVMSIIGYRGDDLTASTGTDPQTILADGAATPVDVIANQSNPNTNNTGGVAEFDGIANPTVALQGSGTADAPHLVIRLNKKSCPDTKFVSISYKVRDIDGSADNAVQPVALHYRVGDTGSFINLPEAFIPDATDPNTATKETSVYATLPHIPLGQDLIFLRIMTANAAGNDEWVGIDDISIGCFAPTAASVPVGGRVVRGKSQGVSRATVLITDEYGGQISVRTNAFGYYRFDSVPAGETYTVRVVGKGFATDPQLITVNQAIEDLDFVVD
ncbi:MAG: carboxypeptidase regulatory-like domain-containing protein [Acidobacteria bacterium]|nr:carboxypeptidase regulatory-like domain-containing protein [Acidobacteriota bacterium]MBK8149140.1 carboxypeptidase regulatory-like domain-containing protein [Acidobacteriota bacterium]